MSEKVVIRQNSDFETEIWASNPEAPELSKLRFIKNIHDLTPYGMLLASLGTCTAIVLHTYAQHHGLDLNEAELTVTYHRIFKEDCEHCEEISQYEEQIKMDMKFKGNLTPQEHDKLFKISMQCPIHKMLQRGVEVKSQAAKD